MSTKELQKIREIISRKSSIPRDGESFEDIEKAYDYVLELMDLAIANAETEVVK